MRFVSHLPALYNRKRVERPLASAMKIIEDGQHFTQRSNNYHLDKSGISTILRFG